MNWNWNEKNECFFFIFNREIISCRFSFFFCFVNQFFFLSLFVLLNYQTIGMLITIAFLSCFGSHFFYQNHNILQKILSIIPGLCVVFFFFKKLDILIEREFFRFKIWIIFVTWRGSFMHFFIERGHSLRILASDRFGNNLFIRSGFFFIPFLYYL